MKKTKNKTKGSTKDTTTNKKNETISLTIVAKKVNNLLFFKDINITMKCSNKRDLKAVLSYAMMKDKKFADIIETSFSVYKKLRDELIELKNK